MQAHEVNGGRGRHVPLTFGHMGGMKTLQLLMEGAGCFRRLKFTKASYYLSLTNPLRTYLWGIST